MQLLWYKVCNVDCYAFNLRNGFLSIRKLLIITLVFLFASVALVQTALTIYFKQQIENEIVDKSERLTEKILTTTKDKVRKKLIEIAPNDGSNKEVKFEFHISAESESDSHSENELVDGNTTVVKRQIVLDQDNERSIEIFSKNAEQIEAVFMAVDNLDNMQLHHQVTTEYLTDSSSFERFTHLILWSIAISSAIALLLALWLTNKITQPINQLIGAMDELDKDKLGIQITPKGVTELKRCAQQFNSMSTKLANFAEEQHIMEQKKHLAQLGELSRGIAHALRNPVHTLNLTIDQYFKAPEENRAKLEHITHTKIEHIDKNINALLTLSKGKVERTLPVPINAVLNDIKLELLNEATPITINCNNDLKITGLETEIRSILHTLIVNAVEAGKNNNTIKVDVCEQGDEIHLDVLDKGNGVCAEIKPHLFSPHVSDKPDGAGIGLYLAKQIINLYYGGDILLINSDGHGSHFRAIFKREL